MSNNDAGAVPNGCTNFKLRRLTRLVTRHYEAFFAETGLRITQYTLLSHVLRLDAVPCSDLAAALDLSPSALTRTLQPLLQQGWLELGAGHDARRRFVQATPAGRAKRDEVRHVWKQAQLALNERLGAARVAALHTLLDDSTEVLAHRAPIGNESGEEP